MEGGRKERREKKRGGGGTAPGPYTVILDIWECKVKEENQKLITGRGKDLGTEGEEGGGWEKN